MGCGCVVGALTFAGCATPGYNPTRLESELVNAGTTPSQAECVTNGLSAKFDTNQLGSHSPPSLIKVGKTNENEYEVTRDVLKACKVTLALSPLPH